MSLFQDHDALVTVFVYVCVYVQNHIFCRFACHDIRLMLLEPFNWAVNHVSSGDIHWWFACACLNALCVHVILQPIAPAQSKFAVGIRSHLPSRYQRSGSSMWKAIAAGWCSKSLRVKIGARLTHYQYPSNFGGGQFPEKAISEAKIPSTTHPNCPNS